MTRIQCTGQGGVQKGGARLRNPKKNLSSWSSCNGDSLPAHADASAAVELAVEGFSVVLSSCLLGSWPLTPLPMHSLAPIFSPSWEWRTLVCTSPICVRHLCVQRFAHYAMLLLGCAWVHWTTSQGPSLCSKAGLGGAFLDALQAIWHSSQVPDPSSPFRCSPSEGPHALCLGALDKSVWLAC